MTCTASAGLNQDGLLPSRASLPCRLGDKRERCHEARSPAALVRAMNEEPSRGLATEPGVAQLP